MKKVNLLRPMSRGIFALLFVLMMFSSNDANAQSAATFDARIAHYASLQQTFVPGSAKYDIVGSAVTYLEWMKAKVAQDPNYMADANPGVPAQGMASAPQIKKTRPSILANYSPSELAAFQSQYTSMSSDGVNPNAGVSVGNFNKVKWILEANAY